MQVKVKIEDGRIISAAYTQEAKPGHPRKPLVCTEDTVEWKRRWRATSGYDGIYCESKRPGKAGGMNTVTYHVSPSGIGTLYLTMGGNKVVLKRERLFMEAGTITGTLYLNYEQNGHRYASFYSDRLRERCKALGFFMRRLDPKNHPITITSIHPFQMRRRADGLTEYDNGRRRIYTYGQVELITEGNANTFHFDDARWVLYLRYNAETGDHRCKVFSPYIIDEMPDLVEFLKSDDFLPQPPAEAAG